MTIDVVARRRALEALQQYGSKSAALIAQMGGFGESTLRAWRTTLKKHGTISPKPVLNAQNRRLRMDPVHLEYLLQFLYDAPFSYAQEMVQHLLMQTGTKYSVKALRGVLRELGITRKACASLRAPKPATLRYHFVLTPIVGTFSASCRAI